jgi:UDP-N-acetylmuramyl pentapeptide phosphotransferase/UDP-N-acetylglucosamine-1-phosphate transferase
LVTGDPMTVSGVLVLFLMACLGLVGFIDDFIKLFMRRSLGLRSGAKLVGQAVAGAVMAILAVRFPDSYDFTPASLHLSFLTDFGVSIGPVLFVVWVVVMVTGTSNAVNLTDGLDGLASGAAIVVLAAYVIIGDLGRGSQIAKRELVRATIDYRCQAGRGTFDVCSDVQETGRQHPALHCTRSSSLRHASQVVWRSLSL